MNTIELFKVRMEPSAAERVAAVLASGYIGQGPRCEEFEREFGQLVGAPEPPLLLNSCTSAIDLALHLIGVGPGDEVITTPITCTATNSPPALRGARLVWADCDPLTGNIDPADVERKLTAKTRAIIAVNWGGRLCDYDRLHAINGDHWLAGNEAAPIIEDAAHGPFGGNVGHYICWSFQAIKHLTMGDGGALAPLPDDLERARLLRWYGLDRRSKADFRCEQDITEIGGKTQSNDIAAAIGLANLPRTEWSVSRSRLNSEFYDRALRGLPGITLPPFDPGASYWIHTILIDDRPSFMAYLKEHGIATSQVHRRNDAHTAFKAISEWRGPSPGADYFDAHQCAIPNGWWVTEEQRDHIAGVITDWAYSHRKEAA